MAKQMMSARLETDVLGWAKKYAKQRDVSLATVLEAALREFREACGGGVPDLEQPHVAGVKEMGPVAPIERGEWERTMRSRQARLNKGREG